MGIAGLVAILGSVLAIAVGVIIVMYIVVPLARGLGWVIRQAGRFVIGEIGDALRIVGAVLTQLVLAPLVIANIIIGRWSAAGHYGRAMQAECATAGACIYRMALGHPARLLCLTALTDGIEKRLPQVVAAAPTADRPHAPGGRGAGKAGQFEGYRIVGSLPGGGSGGKLYVAEPDTMKRAIFERNGQTEVRNVVIKTFSLHDGSSLPQIVRESRALDAAKRLGLVLEHELSNDRFYYVTRYVPGESLGLVTQRLHAMSGGEGLGASQLQTALGYSADLLRTLDTYHKGGLWHKDVKPDNIIVDATSAHLVDFGLVTPLRSAMTLTTHGTEYFRDPDMVRMALKGVKVHQVDGARFDVYAAGAVLFSMIENSFPAHGGLSQISKRCPEALRWIVRRAMTEYDKRYASAAAMLADLDFVRLAPDPFAVKPVDLPSMRGFDAPLAGGESPVERMAEEQVRRSPEPVGVGAGSAFGGVGAVAGGVGAVGAAAAAMGAAAAGVGAKAAGVGAGVAGGIGGGGRARPRIRVKHWWSGGYEAEEGQDGLRQVFPGVYVSGNLKEALHKAGSKFGVKFGDEAPARPAAPWTPRASHLSAREQVESARARAAAARGRARARMSGRRRTGGNEFKTMNAGVGVALLLFAAVVVAFALMFTMVSKRGVVRIISNYGDGAEPSTRYASADLTVGGAEGSGVDMRGAGASANVRVRSSATASPRVFVNGVEAGVSGASSGPAATATPGAGRSVLVISDLQPLPESVTATIGKLRAAGFELLGNYPGNPRSGGELDEQLQLAAEAQMAREMRQLDAPDLSRDLSEWLAGQEGLDALVWFGRGDGPGAARLHLFTPGLDPEDRGVEQRDRTFQSIMNVVAPAGK